MNINHIIIIILIIIFGYYIVEFVLNKKEHLWVSQNPNINPKCEHVKSFKKSYVSNWSISNYSDAYDCYNKCINDADCQYVGVGFDCYNNCFDNME